MMVTHMDVASPTTIGLAAQWRGVRRLYPIYCTLAKEFGLGEPPIQDLSSVADGSEPKVIETVLAWLGEMDAIIKPHQFRRILQGSDIGDSEDKLHLLVRRHLDKRGRSEADRDKLDFLLSQYFNVCAPP